MPPQSREFKISITTLIIFVLYTFIYPVNSESLRNAYRRNIIGTRTCIHRYEMVLVCQRVSDYTIFASPRIEIFACTRSVFLHLGTYKSFCTNPLYVHARQHYNGQKTKHLSKTCMNMHKFFF